MAIKKYALLTSLMLSVAATGAYAQLQGVINVADSSKIPAKRMAQQNEWLNHSPNEPFPAKPRNMWQLGVYGGAFIVDGDVSPYPGLPGWNVGIQARKALGYLVSVRAQLGYGVTKGLDYKKNPNFLNNTNLEPYRASNGGPGFYVPNFKTQAILPSVDLLLSMNNLMFHKKQSKVNWYVLGGTTPLIYRTKLDLGIGVSANGATYASLYDYASLPAGFFDQSRKDIKKYLKDNFFDGEYETYARTNDRAQNFGEGGDDKWQIRHSWDLGTGLEFRLSDRLSLGAEIKYVFTEDDYIDGWKFVGGTTAHTPQNDNLILGNLSVNFNIGKSSKRVAPLWQLNPLGYLYGEIQNPTHLQIKPILDDADGDGVVDQFDVEPNTPAGCPVDTKGKSRDTDGDGVPDCRDKELITPTQCQPVDAEGVGKCPDPECCDKIGTKTEACQIGSLPSVQFKSGVKLTAEAEAILAAAAAQIKANPTCKVIVVGYMEQSSKRAEQLSWDRVNTVIKYLVEKQGVSRDRLLFKHGQAGAANTVDLQDATGQTAESYVTPPHPQFQTSK